MLTAVQPGLRLREAAVANLASTAVANTLPGGGALGVGVTMTMQRSWGIPVGSTALATVVSGIWNNFVKLGLPVVALGLLAISGGASGALMTAAVVGLAVLVGAIAPVRPAAPQRGDGGRGSAPLAGRVATALRRAVRMGPVERWDERAVAFRDRHRGVARTPLAVDHDDVAGQPPVAVRRAPRRAPPRRRVERRGRAGSRCWRRSPSSACCRPCRSPPAGWGSSSSDSPLRSDPGCPTARRTRSPPPSCCTGRSRGWCRSRSASACWLFWRSNRSWRRDPDERPAWRTEADRRRAGGRAARSRPMSDAARHAMFVRRRHALGAGLALLVVAGVLTFFVARDPVQPAFQGIDDRWHDWMIDGRTPALTRVARVLQRDRRPAGDGAVAAPGGRRAWRGRAAGCSSPRSPRAVVTSELCIGPLKAALDRPRPLGSLVTTDSAAFPSGHAIAASVTAIGLVVVLAPGVQPARPLDGDRRRLRHADGDEPHLPRRALGQRRRRRRLHRRRSGDRLGRRARARSRPIRSESRTRGAHGHAVTAIIAGPLERRVPRGGSGPRRDPARGQPRSGTTEQPAEPVRQRATRLPDDVGVPRPRQSECCCSRRRCTRSASAGAVPWSVRAGIAVAGVGMVISGIVPTDPGSANSMREAIHSLASGLASVVLVGVALCCGSSSAGGGHPLAGSRREPAPGLPPWRPCWRPPVRGCIVRPGPD